MVNAFGDYARPQPPTLRPIALNALLDDVLDLYENDQRIGLARDLADGEPLVRADAVRLRQALHNLIKNALEAIGEAKKPQMVVSTRIVRDDEQRLRRARRRRQWAGFADRIRRALVRAVHDEQEQGHGPRARGRQENRRGAWRQHPRRESRAGRRGVYVAAADRSCACRSQAGRGCAALTFASPAGRPRPREVRVRDGGSYRQIALTLAAPASGAYRCYSAASELIARKAAGGRRDRCRPTSRARASLFARRSPASSASMRPTPAARATIVDEIRRRELLRARARVRTSTPRPLVTISFIGGASVASVIAPSSCLRRDDGRSLRSRTGTGETGCDSAARAIRRRRCSRRSDGDSSATLQALATVCAGSSSASAMPGDEVHASTMACEPLLPLRPPRWKNVGSRAISASRRSRLENPTKSFRRPALRRSARRGVSLRTRGRSTRVAQSTRGRTIPDAASARCAARAARISAQRARPSGSRRSGVARRLRRNASPRERARRRAILRPRRNPPCADRADRQVEAAFARSLGSGLSMSRESPAPLSRATTMDARFLAIAHGAPCDDRVHIGVRSNPVRFVRFTPRRSVNVLLLSFRSRSLPTTASGTCASSSIRCSRKPASCSRSSRSTTAPRTARPRSSTSTPAATHASKSTRIRATSASARRSSTR